MLLLRVGIRTRLFFIAQLERMKVINKLCFGYSECVEQVDFGEKFERSLFNNNTQTTLQ